MLHFLEKLGGWHWPLLFKVVDVERKHIFSPCVTFVPQTCVRCQNQHKKTTFWTNTGSFFPKISNSTCCDNLKKCSMLTLTLTKLFSKLYFSSCPEILRSRTHLENQSLIKCYYCICLVSIWWRDYWTKNNWVRFPLETNKPS